MAVCHWNYRATTKINRTEAGAVQCGLEPGNATTARLHPGGDSSAPASSPISGKEIDMLILIRRIGESIRINDNVTVRVMAATGNKAVLGITAPKAIVVRDWESCPHQRI
ncbi:hypothetical protein E8F12_05770 [Pseudomonas sp. BN102]|nr:hypothetical protein [Pseudomonas sp. BN102]